MVRILPSDSRSPMRPTPPPLRALPAFTDNYIWLLGEPASAAAVIVDPGDAAPVLHAFAPGTQPLAVLLTHHHADHIGGVPALRQRWPQLPVYAPQDARIAQASMRVSDGQRLVIGPWQFDVLAVPGHTRSHLAFYGHGLLFSGDTLFSLGCGRLFEGSPEQMLASLDRLAALPDTTLVCCGHEYTQANARFARVVEPDNPALQRRERAIAALRRSGQATVPAVLADELACNPFLRVDRPEVIASIRAHDPDVGDARNHYFAALRRWKDGF